MNKEILEPQCKNCGHIVGMHYGKWWKIEDHSICMVGPWCKCQMFIPLDKLEYLEWRYDVQQKTLSTEK